MFEWVLFDIFLSSNPWRTEAGGFAWAHLLHVFWFSSHLQFSFGDPEGQLHHAARRHAWRCGSVRLVPDGVIVHLDFRGRIQVNPRDKCWIHSDHLENETTEGILSLGFSFSPVRSNWHKCSQKEMRGMSFIFDMLFSIVWVDMVWSRLSDPHWAEPAFLASITSICLGEFSWFLWLFFETVQHFCAAVIEADHAEVGWVFGLTPTPPHGNIVNIRWEKIPKKREQKRLSHDFHLLSLQVCIFQASAVVGALLPASLRLSSLSRLSGLVPYSSTWRSVWTDCSSSSVALRPRMLCV